MNESAKDTLATLARCVTQGGANLESALKAAYQLGKLDGGMEMASVGQKMVEKLQEAA